MFEATRSGDTHAGLTGLEPQGGGSEVAAFGRPPRALLPIRRCSTAGRLCRPTAEEYYAEEHIPGSVNIPEDNLEEEVPERFADDDEIIVYCIDEDCNASPRSAETIDSLGFENVWDYEPGIEGWKAEGLDVAAANPT